MVLKEKKSPDPFYVFMGHLIVSVILSVFLTLMFESPFIGLEKLLFSGPQKKRAEFKRQQSQIQIYVEKPDTSIHVQYQNDDSASWGWAATTTTLDYQTNFKPLDEKHMMREMRFSNGTFIPVSISGFQIELKRKVNYYIFNYFVPSSLFVAVSWVSFIIPPESIPGRIALIITTLLVLVNIANTVFAISPAADAINALQTWILACICFVVSTAIEYSVVLFITRRHRRRKLLTLMHIKNPAQMGSLLFLKKPVVETNNTSSQPHSSANRSTTPNEADNERAMSQRSCQPLESQEEEADRILEAKIANMDFIFILILPAAFGSDSAAQTLPDRDSDHTELPHWSND
ncbi:hypothetical protein TCAL_17155 [Tigriopus californicus]|uniref:Neurotransmitter-gated ion-channel transmembrane domain-containing protein n=1 Tax=Tigriopus californicus TaxID=6832 RepID=A0A553P2E5_TIGCA|nr:hypothetical protein TCAL_17155 [Tigriopus californicus]